VTLPSSSALRLRGLRLGRRSHRQGGRCDLRERSRCGDRAGRFRLRCPSPGDEATDDNDPVSTIGELLWIDAHLVPDVIHFCQHSPEGVPPHMRPELNAFRLASTTILGSAKDSTLSSRLPTSPQARSGPAPRSRATSPAQYPGSERFALRRRSQGVCVEVACKKPVENRHGGYAVPHT
jgi:hypothetical protein